MGFNIGSLIGGLAPIIGGIFGGPGGAAIGAAVGGIAQGLDPVRVSSPPGRATAAPALLPPQMASQTAPTAFSGAANRFGGFQPAALRFPTGVAGGAIGGAAVDAFSSMFGSSGGTTVSQILKKARANTGGSVTRNNIIAAAKTCGIDTAAATFGLDAREICLIVMKGSSRRRRGISASDIRRTKRVIRFNKKLTKDLKSR